MAEETLSVLETAAPVDLSALAAEAAFKVTAYIESHLSRPVLVRDLARVARLSDRHFHRAFRWRFGVSPHVYIILRRVRVAQRLMLETDDSLSQIALASGMSDQAHFTRTFRRVVGDTPRRWRMARRLGQFERSGMSAREPQSRAGTVFLTGGATSTPIRTTCSPT